MKKVLFTIYISLFALVFASCVSLSEMEALQARYDQTARQYSVAQQELLELREENSVLARQNQTLNTDYADLSLANQACQSRTDSLNRRIEQLSHHYDTTMENYIQQVAGKSRDLTRAQNLLTARTKELADKERELQARQTELQEQQSAFALQRSEYQAKQATFEAKQADLERRQKELEQQQAATRAQLEAKEHELEALRTSVSNALTGFAGKGLNIETRDGKVYVSLENKLLFPSASWTVSKDGVNAIKQLAKVLESDSSLNIIVEGHTDNDPYRGNTAVRDNWDLSVMRATAIVKLLLQNGPAINPTRIQACGHGEYSPKVPNDSPANKAINRRTEIIISPNIENLLEEVKSGQ